MPSFKRILVPVDFSEASRSALDHAVQLAWSFGATVDVLHVWREPLPVLASALQDIPRTLATHDALRERAEARHLLELLLAEVRRRGRAPRAMGAYVLPGDPVHTILEVAHTARHDLIVMGTRGRRGLAQLLLGSVAQQVVRAAPCQVLTVHGARPSIAADAAHPGANGGGSTAQSGRAA